MSSQHNSPIWWPTSTISEPPRDLIIATANYNTKEHIARLLWSLYRFLGAELRSILIVDNGSTDGSVELLQAVADAGLCTLIRNTQNNHHGPALSQAISHAAQMQGARTAPRPWLWLLDSDCMIAQKDAARAAIDAATDANVALVGEAYWNRWHAGKRFAGYSLLLDPAKVWRAEVGVIPDGGDPIGDFEQACRAQGLASLSFPFTKEGYLIHVGRSTLAVVHQGLDRENPLYEWAREHHEPHFQEIPNAETQYAALVAAFNQEVPVLRAKELRAEELIRACDGGRRSVAASAM